jgi:hypothetical protein
MSDVTKTVVEEFDAEGNLVKRTTTTVETGINHASPTWTFPNTSPAFPPNGIRVWS